MFKINGKRFTYDIGNKQNKADNSYPIDDTQQYEEGNANRIITDDNFIKEGDDISPLTKETLSKYLKDSTLGIAGSNKHRNDFPINATPDIQSNLTNKFGYPSDLKDPQPDQKKFISRNEKTLSSFFNEKGLTELENNGFRKGLDESGRFNGQELLNKHSSIATEKYLENNVSGILRNNRFSPNKKFINDFNTPQDINLEILTGENKFERDEFGISKKQYKSIRTDQLSIIGTQLLNNATVTTANLQGSLIGDGKYDKSIIDIKKIFEDSIKNSNDFKTDDKYEANEKSESAKIYPVFYNHNNPYGILNLDFNLNSLLLKAIFLVVVAAGVVLVTTIESALSNLPPHIFGSNTIINKLEKMLFEFELSNSRKEYSKKDDPKDLLKSIQNDVNLIDKESKKSVEKILFRGLKQFFGFNNDLKDLNNLSEENKRSFFSDSSDSLLFSKQMKSVLFDIIKDNGHRIKLVNDLFKRFDDFKSSIANIPNTALEILKIYADSKLRKFSEFILYLGYLNYVSDIITSNGKSNPKNGSVFIDPDGTGNTDSKSNHKRYKYNNDLPALFLLPSQKFFSGSSIDSSPLKKYSNIGSFFVDESTNGNTIISESDKLDRYKEKIDAYKSKYEERGDVYIPFYIQDLRTKEIISFHAFIESVSDDFSPNFEGIDSFGRLEPIKIYKDTQRKINVSFTMLATNKEDFDLMWFKINKMLTLIYPQYTYGRTTDIQSSVDPKFNIKTKIPFTQIPFGTPVVRLRVGDLIKSNYSENSLDRLFTDGTENDLVTKEDIEKSPFKKYFNVASSGLPGIIDTLSFDWGSSVWELDPGSQAPKEIKVTIGFTVIHDITPGIDHNGFNRAPVYNIGQLNQDIFGLDGSNNKGKRWLDSINQRTINKISETIEKNTSTAKATSVESEKRTSQDQTTRANQVGEVPITIPSDNKTVAGINNLKEDGKSDGFILKKILDAAETLIKAKIEEKDIVIKSQTLNNPVGQKVTALNNEIDSYFDFVYEIKTFINGKIDSNPGIKDSKNNFKISSTALKDLLNLYTYDYFLDTRKIEERIMTSKKETVQLSFAIDRQNTEILKKIFPTSDGVPNCPLFNRIILGNVTEIPASELKNNKTLNNILSSTVTQFTYTQRTV